MASGLWSDQAFTRNMLSESVAATAVFFGSAFWYRKGDPKNQKLLALERDLQLPVIAEKASFDPSGFHVYRLLGQVCIVLGSVLGLCVFLPSSPVSPSTINLVAGVFLLLLGVLLVYSARERKT
jgi:Na+/H+ antiporter NhaD/arsenite permease-like protein